MVFDPQSPLPPAQLESPLTSVVFNADRQSVARRLIAGSLIMFGMIIAQVGAFVWWVDREIVDPDQLGAVAMTVVRDPEFRAAVAPEIADHLLSQNAVAAFSGDRDVIIAAVDVAMRDPVVVRTIGRGVNDFASAVMGTGDDVIEIELAELQTSAVAVLADIDPPLAEQIASFGPPPNIELDVGRFPDLSRPASLLTIAWMVMMGLGGAAAILGTLIHPRPAKGLRRIGALLAIGAAIQLGLIWVAVEVVVVNIPGSGIATAGGIGLRIVLGGWRVQAVAQLIVGGSIAVVGHLVLWIPNLVHRTHAIAA